MSKQLLLLYTMVSISSQSQIAVPTQRPGSQGDTSTDGQDFESIVLRTSGAALRAMKSATRVVQGAELLKQARQKYMAKDLMGALKLYEDVLGQEGATTRQLQEALYGSTAVHATFGDVELAQITLREAIKQGLDFDQALSDPELPELVTSPQILIQLKRFNQQAQTAMAARSKAKTAPWGSNNSISSSRAKSKPSSASPLDQDLGSILGSATSDKAGVDTSVGAIIRRVALLLLVGIGLGTAMFFIGLQTLFPKY